LKAEGFSYATAASLRAARIQLVCKQPDVLLTELQVQDATA
jgi:hypothetical protein